MLFRLFARKKRKAKARNISEKRAAARRHNNKKKVASLSHKDEKKVAVQRENGRTKPNGHRRNKRDKISIDSESVAIPELHLNGEEGKKAAPIRPHKKGLIDDDQQAIPEVDVPEELVEDAKRRRTSIKSRPHTRKCPLATSKLAKRHAKNLNQS